MRLFSRSRSINQFGPNPQYYQNNEKPNPPGSHNGNTRYKVHPASVTSGFDESQNQQWQLHYILRAQPDIGGALDFAYANYGLPLQNVCGPWMVARHPTRPLGSQPLAFFQTAPVTSIGGLIPGQIIAQPLLDPDGPGSGFDIYS